MMQVHKISTSFGIFPNQTYIHKRIFSGYSTYSSYFLILHPLKKYILHCEILNHQNFKISVQKITSIQNFISLVFFGKIQPSHCGIPVDRFGWLRASSRSMTSSLPFPIFFFREKKNLNCHITKKTSRLSLQLAKSSQFFLRFFFLFVRKMSLSFIQCPELQSIS